MLIQRSNDYMHMGVVMRIADRKLHSFICNAAYYLRQADELMADYNDLEHYLSYYKGMREDWPAMARLYRQLCQAELMAARSFISDLNEDDLISLEDYYTIKHWLVWFGFPAEAR